MPDTNNALQIAFDPRYEWQGDHYEWQGSEVRSIQDNINPKRAPTSAFGPLLQDRGEMYKSPDITNGLSKGFAIMALATPFALGCGFLYTPLLWVFLFLWCLCGIGGATLPLCALIARSRRLFASGAFGLCMFAAIFWGFYLFVWR